MKMRRLILIIVVVIAAGFLLIQLVPYGRAHDNPPVVTEPNWDSPQTRELAQRACYNCHSYETQWPRYANVAPVSWLVQRDVDEGRIHLNFSDWNQSHEGPEHEVHEPETLGEVILNGEMPPANYMSQHPEARLTDAERAALAEGLLATAAQSSTAEGDDHAPDEGDPEHEEDEHEAGE